MVSSEGACAAYYAYGRHLEARPQHVPSLMPVSERLHDMSETTDRASRRPFGTCPLPEVAVRPHPARPRQRRPADRRADPAAVRAAFGNDVLAALEDQATVGSAAATTAPRRRGSPSPPIRSWSGRSSSPAATSAGWRSTAPSTTWPSAAPSRCSSRRRSSSKKGCRSPTCSASSPRCAQACDEAGVALVTGDTKVVDRGKGDQVFITTSGIGLVPEGRSLSIRTARPGDRILVSGTIGDHGIAIMSVREGIEFETVLESDTRPADRPDARDAGGLPGDPLHARPDPRRRVERLERAGRRPRGVGCQAGRGSDPGPAEVRGACEMLGLDPLYVANEGKLIAVVPAEDAERLLEVMRTHPLGRNAAIIGEVVAEHPGMVTMRSLVGGERVVTMLAGEQLPRIC